MVRIILLIISSFAFSSIKAQKELTVVYQNNSLTDTGWKKNLFVTVYYSDSIIYGVAEKKLSHPKVVGKGFATEAYYIDYKKSETILQAAPQFLPRYRIKDSTKKFTWTILEEEKEILGFKCKKAISNFEGQTITVWFTPSIPVSIGPTLLNGAPGLILEANFQHPVTSYQALSVHVNSPIIVAPSKGKLVSLAEYKEALRKRDER